MKTTLLFALLTLTFMGIFYACTKSEAATGATTDFKVNLTDNPFDAEEVNIDLKEVRVNYKNGSDEWTVLRTNAGIYNLLELQNGVTSTIASGAVATGLREIRLVLGTDNSIRIKDVVYPLTIPGGAESGLKIKLGRDLRNGMDSVTVDFDAALSVHQTSNGNYILRPVLKLK